MSLRSGQKNTRKPEGDRAATRNKVFFQRQKDCPFSGEKAQVIDYKDAELLSKFVSERGKILPRRLSAVSSKKQRELATAIKRARNLALMPFIDG